MITKFTSSISAATILGYIANALDLQEQEAKCNENYNALEKMYMDNEASYDAA